MIFFLKNYRRTDWFNNPNYGSGRTKRRLGRHSGTDLASSDRNIYMPIGGFKVEAAYWHNVSGNTLRLSKGNVEIKLYHLAKFKTKVGKRPSQNAIIGIYGNTGSGSKGAHLHVTVTVAGRKVDPEMWFASLKKEGPVMPTKQDVKDYFKVYAGKAPTAKQLTYYTKRNWRVLTDDVIRLAVRKASRPVVQQAPQSAVDAKKEVATTVINVMTKYKESL